jgi:hypothetical protein
VSVTRVGIIAAVVVLPWWYYSQGTEQIQDGVGKVSRDEDRDMKWKEYDDI